MDSPSSSAAWSLTRPRLAVAVISAVAAATVGVYMLREATWAAQPNPRGLHRSNAVRRRHRRPSNAHSHARRDSNASTTSAESHGDENHPGENHDEGRDLMAAALQPHTADRETVDAEMNLDDWWEDAMPSQRAGQNIVSLLFRVSEDNARRNAYVHRGCACNACGMVPIRGIRYRCANCADFDLCETCESQGMHIKTHIFYKVKIPAPPFGPRQMQPVFYPGDPDTCLRSLPRQLMMRLSRETGFERPELEAFWEQWTFIANTEWRDDPDELGLAMDRRTFERCLVPSGGYRHTSPSLIHDRMFAFYDTNKDDLIGFSEFLRGLSYRKRKDRLKRIFDGYDVDNNGYIDRRDCLRLFRAYYVLYKQMHWDILEGLDDQVLSSNEAHQLTTSRQPLSGLFGREGRVPDADHDRPMEGKVFHGSGDVALSGEKTGAVNEDKSDTSARDQILTRLFTHASPPPFFVEELFSPSANQFHPPHNHEHGHHHHRHEPPQNALQSPSGPRSADARYFDALLNAPRNTQELQAVITDEPRETIDAFLHALDERQEEGEGNGEVGNDEDQAAQTADVGPHGPHGRASSVTEADIQAATSSISRARPRLNSADLQTRYDEAVDHEHHVRPARATKRARIAARQKLLERWRRRQFYLDEEEGAVAPQGWNPAEDILANANSSSLDTSGKAGRIANNPDQQPPHPLSPRSRSSSKVRFAEDTDDYEVRSNPSTSSRSVPERWGGMEIPDAERDAGKEILYQVTQQAFNELLDALFKEREDLAMQAASTKQLRDQYRPYFSQISSEEGEEEDEDGIGDKLPQSSSPPPPPESTVVPPPETMTVGTGCDDIQPSEEQENQPDPALPSEPMEPALSEISWHTEVHDSERDIVETDKAPATNPGTGEAPVAWYDPTMPQFRPDSDKVEDLPVANEVASERVAAPRPPSPSGSLTSQYTTTSAEDEEDDEPFGAAGHHHHHERRSPSVLANGGRSRSRAADAAEGEEHDERSEDEGELPPLPDNITRATLVHWKRLDLAEEESRARKGWGRLSLEEFEEIYRREERRLNRLDYLGSWIDVCIPYPYS